MRFLLPLFLISFFTVAQTNQYHISFENAVHHEAQINITFPQLKAKTVRVRMPRTSPGRYAIHEFAKNVYDVQATNGAGEPLDISRPDPYSWEIIDHDGTVNLSYTLFANRADGTYSQVDESHAHLNMPATFMFMEGMEHRPITITFEPRKDLNWKIATQLEQIDAVTYAAPHLQYFMDSPTELSDYQQRNFKVDDQNIRFVLHSPDNAVDFDTYWEDVKAIVLQQRAVYGELPHFDYNEYTFLACYAPHVAGDGMEHRNSTILTDRESLANGGLKGNIGTVSHEFFHAWNVERIRPADLEPFDFTAANMSGSLWFAEGFTSYYTNLILARAGIITTQDYVNSLNGTFNYVWNSPARAYFNPIEMSYQAPFVDAATSVDPVNRNNTFISYYSYGSMLGLALDLSLREQGLNLDDYFKAVWNRLGKKEVAYNIDDLQEILADYAGDAFAKAYFNNYIYNSNMPDYESLFASVGLAIDQDGKSATGLSLTSEDNKVIVSRPTIKGTSGYEAGINEGDHIVSINGKKITSIKDYDKIISKAQIGDQLELEVQRFGKIGKTILTVGADPRYTIRIDKDASNTAVKARERWLAAQ